MKRIFLFLLFFGATGLYGQKVLKPIATYLKAKNGTEALKAVEKLRVEDSTARKLPRLYDMGREAAILINEAQNEKVYLKQAYDTALFFSSTLDIYRYTLALDSVERSNYTATGEKIRGEKKGSEMLHRYYANIVAGGKYFYAKKKYATAMDYLRKTLDVPQTDLWTAGGNAPAVTGRTGAAFLYTQSAYLVKNWQEVARYEDILLSDTTQAFASQRAKTVEYLAVSSRSLQDTLRYVHYLTEGVRDYPREMFFFTHLADYYNAQGAHDSLLQLTDSLLPADSTNTLLWEARLMALLGQNRYEEAIQSAQRCTALDTTAADAYYYGGLACYLRAEEAANAATQQGRGTKAVTALRKKYYTEALPYIERYRALRPDEKEKWQPLLYRIYFALNMGPQFEEVSHL